MSIDTLCYACNWLGGILVVIGRVTLMYEAGSFSKLWRFAMILPFAEIMYLARFSESAKPAAITALVGFALLTPLGAKKLWDKEHISARDYADRGHAVSMDAKSDIFLQLDAELEWKIEARKQKLTRLNEHLGAWYANMSTRRAALTNATPTELASFNTEAAAYQSLLEVSKKEAAELQEMLNKKAKGFSAYTDEDFGRFVMGDPNARKRSKGRRNQGETLPDSEEQ